MKIEIDLSDIYEDEDGNRLRVEFVDSVVSSLTSRLQNKADKQLSDEINKSISDIVNTKLNVILPAMMEQMLDFEYEQVSPWGEKNGKWTIRNKIAGAIKDAVGFEKKDFWSSQKETPFTKLVVKAIGEAIKPMADEMRASMNLEFKKACIAEAARQLQERMQK